MKKFSPVLLLIALLFCGITAHAQSAKIQHRVKLPAARPGSLKSMPMPAPLSGFEAAVPTPPTIPAASPTMFRSLNEEIAGTTAYDRQSNKSEQNRLHVWPNGEISTAWTMSFQEESANAGSTWTDRGTGYNKRSDWQANITPTTRLESERTGFANYVVTDDGTEINIAHRLSTAGVYILRMSRRVAGGSWVQSDIPSAVPKGVLWCKVTTDGNNVYVLSLSTPVNTAGAIYKGLDGHLLFWRSQDAGATWDIQDGIIPGIDNTTMAAISGDSYAIDAHNGTLAVALFDSWNDALIYKSTNGGTTWEPPFTVIDFPLEKYVANQGYTIADIGGIDPTAAALGLDSTAIFSSDGAVSVLVDNAGYVHAWAGRMWVNDANLADAGANYYPGINGLMYWNEFTADQLFIIAGAPDINGNDTLDIVGEINPVAYGCNMSSMATSAMSQDEIIYVAISALIENLSDIEGNPLRHVLLLKSPDYGATWEDMYDVHYETNDVEVANYQEGVFPYFAKHLGSDNIAHMVYQRDYLAGSAVTMTTGFQPGASDIVYVAANSTGTKEPVSTIALSVSPNPASNLARVRFELKKAAPLQIEVFNMTGQRVMTQQGDGVSDANAINLNVAALPGGLYFLRLNAGNTIGVAKLTVAK
jgi:hypothetical protein